MTERTEFLQGMLDLLILKSLRAGALHGWGISKRIREVSHDALQVNQGSLYPALYRLENRGLLKSHWSLSNDGRKVKLYALTAAGVKQFAIERSGWRRFAGAIEQVLQTP